jgi:hypothetical protein
MIKGGRWKVDHNVRGPQGIRGYSAILTLTIYGSPIGRLDTMSGSRNM